MQRIRLAALVLVVGVLVAGVWAAAGVLDQIQRPAEFVRAEPPGSVSVTLSQVGPHVVYWEATQGSGAADRDGHPDSSLVTVADPGGRPVPVRPYPAELRYDWDTRLGTAFAVFDAPRTGTYLVSVGNSGPPGVLALGDDLAPGLMRALVPPAGALLAATTVAVLLVWAPAGPGRSIRHDDNKGDPDVHRI